MLGISTSRFHVAGALMCAVLLAGGIAGCASSDPTSMGSSSHGQSISDVQVSRDGADTIVTLMVLDDPVFTAFGQADPDRVIIDVTRRPGHMVDPIAVNDGLVREVSLSPYATGTGSEMTRVEVLLDSPASFEVEPTASGLSIRISADIDGLASDSMDDAWTGEDAVAFDPWTGDTTTTSEVGGTLDEESGTSDVPAPAAFEDTPATKLTSIDVEETTNGILVQLRSDGAIASVITFTLEDPSRLVIDLPDLANEAPEENIELGSDRVERIRIGQHADKIRVVIDGGSNEDAFDGRRVVPTTGGLVIALGSGDDIDAALAMSTEPAVTEQLQRDAAVVATESEVALADIESVVSDADTSDESASEEAESSDPWASLDAWDSSEAASETESLEIASETDAPQDPSETESAWIETDTVAMTTPELESEKAADVAIADVAIADVAIADVAIADAEIADVAIADAAIDDELAPDTIEIAEATPQTVVIYGIEFTAQKSRDRIVVLGDAPIEYRVYEPAPETVVISLADTRIDPEAAVRITPEVGGPVSLVTAFQQPELETPEVRLVVQRAPNLMPDISRRGSLLIIDFENTGAVAAAPPVMSPVGEPTVASASDPDPAIYGQEAYETGESVPASIPTSAMAEPVVAMAQEVMPAAMEPGASIDVLRSGGLIDGKQYSGRRISLDFKDVDVSDVLRLIAEVSELNVIAGDEVKGKVTIRLVDVPWDQALDVVLLTKGLGFMRIGNVLRIAPADVIQTEEELRLQERRAKEKLEDLIVKLQPVNYADVGQIKGMVERLLSPRGTVNADIRTSTLIIKDIPSVIDEATALVKAIDTQTPQVMIEAKIVEASLDFSREFGAVWGVGAQPFVDGFDTGSDFRQDLGGSDLNFHPSQGSQFGGNNAVFSNPITAFPNGLFNLAAFLLDQKLNLELQLQAAEVNGDGKVISSPRVVTLDNSKATIEQGVSIPFQTFENGDAQLEFVDAVLKLDVTPHITANRSIIMKIKVTRNAPDDSVFTLTGSPAIAKNQVKTETLVKDGQTLVLGGIYIVDKSDRQARVPYLHNIPLIGAMFRSDEHSESRKELLIFVTPRIVVTEETDA
jgi:type IV pilus assembly protein PilQ